MPRACTRASAASQARRVGSHSRLPVRQRAASCQATSCCPTAARQPAVVLPPSAGSASPCLGRLLARVCLWPADLLVLVLPPAMGPNAAAACNTRAAANRACPATMDASPNCVHCSRATSAAASRYA